MLRRCLVQRLIATGGWNSAFLRAVSATASAARKQALFHVARGGLDDLSCAVASEDMDRDEVGRILGTNVSVLSSTKAWHLASPSHVLHLIDAFLRFGIPVDDIIAAAMLPALGNMMPLFTSSEVAHVLRALHRLRVPLPAPLLVGALSVLSEPTSLDVWLVPCSAPASTDSSLSAHDGGAQSISADDGSGSPHDLLRLLEGVRTLYVVVDHSQAALQHHQYEAHRAALTGFAVFAAGRAIERWIDACADMPTPLDATTAGAALEIGLLFLEIFHHLRLGFDVGVGDGDIMALEARKSVQSQVLSLICPKWRESNTRGAAVAVISLGTAWVIRALNTAPYWIDAHRCLLLSACAPHMVRIVRDSAATNSAGSLLRLFAAAARAEDSAHQTADEPSAHAMRRVGGRTSNFTYQELLVAVRAALRSGDPNISKASASALLNALQALHEPTYATAPLPPRVAPPLRFPTWNALRVEIATLMHRQLAHLLVDGDVSEDFLTQVSAVLATQAEPLITVVTDERLVADFFHSRAKLVDACFAALFVTMSHREGAPNQLILNSALAVGFVADIVTLDGKAKANGALVVAKATTRFERLAAGKQAEERIPLSPSCCWPWQARSHFRQGVAKDAVAPALSVGELREHIARASARVQQAC